jgi:hypothetical protein
MDTLLCLITNSYVLLYRKNELTSSTFLSTDRDHLYITIDGKYPEHCPSWMFSWHGIPLPP